MFEVHTVELEYLKMCEHNVQFILRLDASFNALSSTTTWHLDLVDLKFCFKWHVVSIKMTTVVPRRQFSCWAAERVSVAIRRDCPLATPERD